MQLVLTGVAWRCDHRRDVAVLTGELFDSAPQWSTAGARAKSLGTCAFSGAWPVSNVDQLGVGTVVRARSRLRRHPTQGHFGALQLYGFDEAEMRAVHADEPTTGGLPSSTGVARPGARHATPLPCVSSRKLTEKRPATTPEDRLLKARTATWQAWRDLWALEERLEELQACGTLPRSLTGAEEGAAVAAAAESVRVARALTESLVEALPHLQADVAAATEARAARARDAVEEARSKSRASHEAKVVGKQGPLAMARQRGSLSRMWAPVRSTPPASTRRPEEVPLRAAARPPAAPAPAPAPKPAPAV